MAALKSLAMPEFRARSDGLRPRLRSHLRWYRHTYRGHLWWVLQDSASGQHYYFTEVARRLMDLLDGCRTLRQACIALEAGGHAPEMDEVTGLIQRLQAADLLHLDTPSDPAGLYKRWQQRRDKMRHTAWLRPLALRLPLADPSHLLDATLPLVRPLFGPVPFIFWVVMVGLAMLLGLQYSTELAAHGSSRFLDPANLLLLWLVYPLVKGLHELGHAFAIRVWGGSVRELGLMLLVFVPVPYVDGSAATAFVDKHRRILVGAAGIMMELLLAALALFLWLAVQPGWLRDLAFDVLVIGGVSTLLFNGNPLLRFDGYYLLADAIEIPNLASRAQQYYGYLARRYLLGMSAAVSPIIASGERAWFLLYGATAAGYRVFISLAIALYVAGKFFIIGMLLAGWTMLSQLLLPALRLMRYLVFDPALRGHRTRALGVGLGIVLTVLFVVLAVPLPSNTVVEGVLWVPERTLIRAAGSGEVVEVLKGNGDAVRSGDTLVKLRNVELEMRRRLLDARAQELLARLEKASLHDRVEAGILREQLDEVTVEGRELQRKLDNLSVVSPNQGILDMRLPEDLPGRFITQGEILGMVRTHGAVTVRLVVPQELAGRVRDQTLAIDLRFAGTPLQRLPSSALRAVPAATHRLPSALLGTQGGGGIAVDMRDPQGTTTIEPVFHFDLELSSAATAYFPGARVEVRFTHAAEPLGPRCYRSLRQLLLARLEV